MTLTARLVGVLRLDPRAFEEIEHAPHATRQAVTIVVLASIAAALGQGTNLDLRALTRESVRAVTGCVMWANASYFLGARTWPEPETDTDLDELLRVMGFAYAPNFFSIFAAPVFTGDQPLLADFILAAVQVWLFAATVVAVRQALDYRSTTRAIVVVFVGWLAFRFISWI
jgi:hypothetical protein